MKIDMNNIAKLDINDIYNMFSSSFNKIYKKYSFINIDRNEFKSMVRETINETKNNYDGEIEYEKYLIKALNRKILGLIRLDMKDQTKLFDIINNYINQEFSKDIDYNSAINSFDKLENFLELCECSLTLDIIERLVKENSLINKLLITIYEVDREDIFNDSYEGTYNDLVVYFIQMFCKVHNIKIKENEIKYSDMGAFASRSSTDIYLREIQNYKLLTREEELDMIKRYKSGEIEVRDEFLSRNLKLVVSIAKKYLGRGVALIDLIQEGNMGLMKALDEFDLSRECRFSTYATNWIKSYITRYIAGKSRNISLPNHFFYELGIFRKVYTNLEKQLDRKPTISELADKTGKNKDVVLRYFDYLNDTKSLSDKVGDEDDTEFSYFIPSSDESLETIAIKKDLSSGLTELLNKCHLKPRELEVLMLRYGLNGDDPLTLEEIGRKYNLTRERVRQMESSALMRIRRSPYVKLFAEYTSNPAKSMENIKKMREAYIDNPRSFKKDIISEGERKPAPRAKNIYTIFSNSGYTKEELDIAINELSEEEIELLKSRYGEDLTEMPTIRNKRNEYTKKFMQELFPKLRRIIKNNREKNMDDEAKKGRKGMKTSKNIYEIFSNQGYSKEELDEAIKCLSKSYIDTLKSRYGEDLMGVPTAKLDKKERSRLYTAIFGRLKKELQKNRERSVIPTSKVEDIVNETTNESVEEYVNIPSEENVDVRDEEVKTTHENTNDTSINEYKMLLELLKTSTFNDMLKVLTPKEAVIVCLRLGYIDNKYFTSESIANFLGIDTLEVTETTKKVLLLYRDNINKIIDTAIENTTKDNERVRKMKPNFLEF